MKRFIRTFSIAAAALGMSLIFGAPARSAEVAPTIKEGVLQTSNLSAVIDAYYHSKTNVAVGLMAGGSIEGSISWRGKGLIALEPTNYDVVYIKESAIIWIKGPLMKKM